jgi:threonine dehydrogenase-like Zn-dependent dehydrogenase
MVHRLDFRGSYCYGGHGTDYAKAFNFINTRQVDVRPMITNLVGLEDVDNSFKVSAAGGDTIKVMFNLPELGKPAVL